MRDLEVQILYSHYLARIILEVYRIVVEVNTSDLQGTLGAQNAVQSAEEVRLWLYELSCGALVVEGLETAFEAWLKLH